MKPSQEDLCESIPTDWTADQVKAIAAFLDDLYIVITANYSHFFLEDNDTEVDAYGPPGDDSPF